MDQLRAMGFGGNGATQALRNADGDIEVAVNMLVAPNRVPSAHGSASPGSASSQRESESLVTLVAMGYPEDQARRALDASAGDANAAAELLMHNAGELHEDEVFSSNGSRMSQGDPWERSVARRDRTVDTKMPGCSDIELEVEFFNPMMALIRGPDGLKAAMSSEAARSVAAEARKDRASRIQAMGFPEVAVARALDRSGGDEADAITFLLAHAQAQAH